MGSALSTDVTSRSGTSTSGDVTRTTRSHLLKLSAAHNKFVFSLINEVGKDGKRCGNICILPMHISLGLGTLLLGARTSTLDQIYHVLNLAEVEKHQLLPAFAALHWDVLRSSVNKGCELYTGLGLFVPNDCDTLPHYKQLCETYEVTRLIHIDFRNRPDLARKEMNHWSEKITNGRVKDPIPPLGYVERESRIFMLCVLSVKLHFLHPFDESKTKKGVFHLQLKETLSVKLMEQRNTFRHAQYPKLDCHILELPCANTYTKLLIFLPNKVDGARKVEEKINKESFDAILDLLAEHTVDVTLPHFRHEAGGLVGDLVQKSGIEAVFFQGKSDLSGIDGTRDLCLSRVYQYGIVEVDEGHQPETPGPSTNPDQAGPSGSEGTRAGTPGSSNGKPGKVKTFKADRPFVFLLFDERTGAIQLCGRVVRPSLA